MAMHTKNRRGRIRLKKSKFSQLNNLQKVAEQIKEEYQSENELEVLAMYINWINADREHEALFFCLHLELFEPDTPDQDILNLWSRIIESLTTWIRTERPDKEHVAIYIETFWKDEPENGIARKEMLKDFSYSQLTKLATLGEEPLREGG